MFGCETACERADERGDRPDRRLDGEDLRQQAGAETGGNEAVAHGNDQPVRQTLQGATDDDPQEVVGDCRKDGTQRKDQAAQQQDRARAETFAKQHGGDAASDGTDEIEAVGPTVKGRSADFIHGHRQSRDDRELVESVQADTGGDDG